MDRMIAYFVGGPEDQAKKVVDSFTPVIVTAEMTQTRPPTYRGRYSAAPRWFEMCDVDVKTHEYRLRGFADSRKTIGIYVHESLWR